jgi:hypothetical protein
MRLFIQLSALILFLWTLPIPAHHHAVLLTLEDDNGIHHFEKAEDKMPYVPSLSTWDIIAVFLINEYYILSILSFRPHLRKRFLYPVFYQGNYITPHIL